MSCPKSAKWPSTRSSHPRNSHSRTNHPRSSYRRCNHSAAPKTNSYKKQFIRVNYNNDKSITKWIKTKNATRCNNRNDSLWLGNSFSSCRTTMNRNQHWVELLHLSFTLKISVFSEAYIYPQPNIYDGAFIAKIVSREVYSQKALS